jgi:C4-dicarboxylate transporter DctM subunit
VLQAIDAVEQLGVDPADACPDHWRQLHNRLLAAKLCYRNISRREIAELACESGVLTAADVFLTAVATIFQYLLGVAGAPALMAELLHSLQSSQWLFLTGVAVLTMLFGMVLEGLPAAVVLVPVLFPIAVKMGVDPVHFDIIQTAAVGIGIFLPPLGVGLLMAVKFAEVPLYQHSKSYWPYLLALWAGLTLIICMPELSLMLPRAAGYIR